MSGKCRLTAVVSASREPPDLLRLGGGFLAGAFAAGLAAVLAAAVFAGRFLAGAFAASVAGAFAVFAGVVLLLAAAFTGFSAELAAGASVFAAVFFAKRPKRPLPRSGAALSSSTHSSRVSVFGSRSFGILAFFTLSVMYGPKRPFST